MTCAEAKRLQDNQNNAWAAWNQVRETNPKAKAQLSRYYEDACVASIQLKDHLQTCAECAGNRQG